MAYVRDGSMQLKYARDIKWNDLERVENPFFAGSTVKRELSLPFSPLRGGFGSDSNPLAFINKQGRQEVDADRLRQFYKDIAQGLILLVHDFDLSPHHRAFVPVVDKAEPDVDKKQYKLKDNLSSASVGSLEMVLVEAKKPAAPGRLVTRAEQAAKEAAAVVANSKSKKETPPVEVKPKIVSIKFLDGTDDTLLAGSADQIVNLPRDKKWVDGKIIKNIDRLSHKPRFKVTFDKPGAHSFTVKLNADAKNNAYTGGEKGRNDKYKYLEKEKNYTTDTDGTKIISGDFFITVGGMDKYHLSAKDSYGNPEVKSSTVETKRVIYYQELKMKGLKSVASNLTEFEGEYSKHKVNLVSLASVEMDHMPNISIKKNSDVNKFKANARVAYKKSGAAKKSPYVVALAYTDHLAIKNPAQVQKKIGVEVGPGKSPVEIVTAATGIVSKKFKTMYLWNKIVPGEDWFVSAIFRKKGGKADDDVKIPKSKVTLIPQNKALPDKCQKLSIDVSELSEATGMILVTVNLVDMMAGGLSFGNGNLICVCARSWWRDKSDSAQNDVIVHEMGHKIGMVSNGSKKLPDKVKTHYTEKGHIGPHCHEGLAEKIKSYSGVSGSKCVMFGATNGKSAFCPNCSPAVRKVDLSGGWSEF